MKTLYLFRHAKSDWYQDIESDFDRPLNKRGFTAAPLMGKKLHERGERPQVVLSSPALRAITTARLVCKENGIPQEHVQQLHQIYNAPIDVLLQVVTQQEGAVKSVMVFGHNPGMSALATYLSGENLQFPTCAVACIDFDVLSWKEISGDTGSLRFFDYPKLYSEMQ